MMGSVRMLFDIVFWRMKLQIKQNPAARCWFCGAT